MKKHKAVKVSKSIMVRENKVLLVCDHDSRLHDMRVILEFLGESVIVSSTKDWKVTLKEFEQSTSDILALIVDHEVTQLEPLLADLRQWDIGIPVLLMGDSDLSSLDPDLRKMVISKFEFPPNYNKFLDNLYRAQVYREQFAASRARGQQRDVQLFRSLVGTSRAIQRVRELMAQVADKEVSVLVTGESGTGKEVVARNLHYNSDRRNKPFVPVNCGAIPAELLESELFGHKKGAFTGATQDKKGLFEIADKGTVFLDEIGEISLNFQVKLLRVLQERVFKPVGGNENIAVDIRIISATNKNLEEEVIEGRFREDLFYRLNVIEIKIPPLRERKGDLRVLVQHFLEKYSLEMGKEITKISSYAIDLLNKYDFPGNIRELENLIERSVALSSTNIILPDSLALSFHKRRWIEGVKNRRYDLDEVVNGVSLDTILSEIETAYIEKAMEIAGGKKQKAAELLGINYTTFRYRLEKINIFKETQ